MNEQPSLTWVRPPQQERSQKRLARMIDAAEELILEVGAENLTVAEVARRADSSVGAFYARFRDKEALLRCVFERFYEEAVATAEDALAPARWEHADIADAVAALMTFMVRTFRQRRRLVAAFTLRAAAESEFAALSESLGERVAVRMRELVAAHEVAVAHRDPERAVSVLVWMVMSALEARTLYSPKSLESFDDEEIAVELTGMALAYLGVESQ